MERGEELRPNAVSAHDPALIPEQAHGNMALHHDHSEAVRRGSAHIGSTRLYSSPLGASEP